MKKSLGFLLGLLFMCSISSAAVLDDAIGWMYDNGLTIHDSKTTFNTNRGLRRDEAAKFFVNYAKELNQTEYVKTADQCVFSDINNARSDLRGIVVESCRLGLFQGSKGMFNPQKQLTNAQATAVLMRMFVGKQNESGLKHRSDNYYKKAEELNILQDFKMYSKNDVATRGNVGLAIYDSNNLYNLEELISKINTGDAFTGNICNKPEVATACSLGVTTCPEECKPEETYSTEVREAYNYAYNEGLTTSSIEKANVYGTINRALMAKIITNFAENTFRLKADNTRNNCNFTDIEDQREEMRGYIEESCKLGIMGYGDTTGGIFNPNAIVTRAQFGTFISRILWGSGNDGGNPYYEQHLKILKDEGIIDNTSTPNASEPRWSIWNIMKRAEEYFKDTQNICEKAETKTACSLGLTTCPKECKSEETYSSEIKEAYDYAYKEGITTKSPIQNANVYGTVNRAQMAKVMTMFAKEVFGLEAKVNTGCSFRDIAGQTEEMKGYIEESCKLGIMGHGETTGTYFDPNGIVTRAQFGTFISRILWGSGNDGGNPYYEKHLKILQNKGIINNISTPNASEPKWYIWKIMKIAEEYFKDPGTICERAETKTACSLGLCPEECKPEETYSSEVKEAYNYAYDEGLTTLSIEKANVYGTINRALMAKIITNFAENTFRLKADNTSNDCNFTDIEDQREEMRGYIEESCKLGIMGYGDTTGGIFNPNAIVTRAQFGTFISRILWGSGNDGGNPYYEQHLKILKDEGIIDNTSTPNASEPKWSIWNIMKRAEEYFKDTQNICNKPETQTACSLRLETCPEECKLNTKEILTGNIIISGINLKVPRIMFWPGKVNQHIDLADGTWKTDPDGKSGGWPSTIYPNDYGDRQLEYCKKFYPDTVSVASFFKEYSDTRKSAGNIGNYESIKQSLLCVQPEDFSGLILKNINLKVPRIMFRRGNVNQHIDLADGTWKTDPDGKSGGWPSTIYPNDYGDRQLEYCKKFYPDTVSVASFFKEYSDTRKSAGNIGNYESIKQSLLCVQP